MRALSGPRSVCMWGVGAGGGTRRREAPARPKNAILMAGRMGCRQPVSSSCCAWLLASPLQRHKLVSFARE